MWDLRKRKNTFRTLKSKVSINVLFKRREHPDYKIFLHSELAQIMHSLSCENDKKQANISPLHASNVNDKKTNRRALNNLKILQFQKTEYFGEFLETNKRTQ